MQLFTYVELSWQQITRIKLEMEDIPLKMVGVAMNCWASVSRRRRGIAALVLLLNQKERAKGALPHGCFGLDTGH